MTDGGNYHSYLLRVWQAELNDKTAWRITLEDVRTGERKGFVNFVDFVAYLQQVSTGDYKTSQGGQGEAQC